MLHRLVFARGWQKRLGPRLRNSERTQQMLNVHFNSSAQHLVFWQAWQACEPCPMLRKMLASYVVLLFQWAVPLLDVLRQVSASSSGLEWVELSLIWKSRKCTYYLRSETKSLLLRLCIFTFQLESIGCARYPWWHKIFVVKLSSTSVVMKVVIMNDVV